MTVSHLFESAEELDRYVERFELALLCGSSPPLEDFLPDRDGRLHDEVLGELIRVEMEHQWERGRRVTLADYRARFPDFFASTSNRRSIALEEFRLRKQAGEQLAWQQFEIEHGLSSDAGVQPAATARIIAASFKEHVDDSVQNGGVDRWYESLHERTQPARRIRDLHHSSPRVAQRYADYLLSMPEVGDQVLGFQLKSELGRGAFGRVFLAEQEALANRLVALKVAPNEGAEPQALAQLQHTHVMPIYSVHHAGALQAVCMPYFGSVTLADVFRDVQSREALPRSGQEVFSTLTPRNASTLKDAPAEIPPPPGDPEPVPASATPGLNKLQGLSYVEAVLWIGSCLADGLQHAHERGILHRDLKPANVLLTDEGQPMLLDFNLAEDTKDNDGATMAMMGGTLPYMAPEQLEAFRGAQRSVDARSDVYSLGVVLYELLTGRTAFAPPQQPVSGPRRTMSEIIQAILQVREHPLPQVEQLNADVSPATASILERCLAPDPAHRYQSAGELHEDLKRQLENRPLKHARERSWRERIRKLVRRSPKLPQRAAIGAALLLFALVGFLAYRLDASLKAEEAKETALRQSLDRHVAREVQATFREYYNEALFHLSTRDDEWHRAQGEEAAQKAVRFFDFLTGQGEVGRYEPNRFPCLPIQDRQRIREQIGTLTLLHVAARMRDAATEQSLDFATLLSQVKEAESYLDNNAPSRAVLLQRADVLEKSGKHKEAEKVRVAAVRVPLQTAVDYFLIGQRLAIRNDHKKAIGYLEKAKRLNPQSYWTHFLRAVCFDRLGLDREAIGAYDAAISLNPDHYGAYFNRGLSHLHFRNHEQAVADFDFVIEKQPQLPNPYVNRALAWMGQKEHRKAVDDLTVAIRLGASSRARFLRSRALRRLGDADGAQRDLEIALSERPTDAMSWTTRGWTRLSKDPRGALADFEQALVLNPLSRKALTNKVHVLSEHLKETKKAIAILDRMSKLFPDHVAVFSGRGVLHARLGDRDAALKDAGHVLESSSDPSHLYQVGCIYALTSRTHPEDRRHAVRWLTKAIHDGFGAQHVATDPDLEPIRHLPEHKKLVQAAATLRRAR